MSYSYELEQLEKRKQEIQTKQVRLSVLLERLRVGDGFSQADAVLLEHYIQDRLHGED